MTTQTLDALIRDLAARGELNHLSIYGGDGKTFHASFAPASVYGIATASDPDPVKAAMMAIAQPRMKRRVTKNMKPTPEPEPVLDDAYDPAA